MRFILKYWRPLLAVIFIIAAVVGWRLDRAVQYQRGYANAVEKIRLENARLQANQAIAVLEKERRQAIELADVQAAVEKDRQHAQNIINNLRGELGCVQQYAARQGRSGNLPATAEAAGASDDDASRGWSLFGRCAERYAGMAEVADQQRNDLAEWQAYSRVVSGE